MKIRTKIVTMVSVPLAALACLVAGGVIEMSGLARENQRLVDDTMMPLIDHFTEIHELSQRTNDLRLLEDGINQARLAEKMVLAADEEESRAIEDAHRQVIAQSDKLLADFVGHELDDEAKPLVDGVQQAFAQWKARNAKVFELSRNPGKVYFARKCSNGGTAEKTFNTLREATNQLIALHDSRIAEARVAIDVERAQADAETKHIMASARSTVLKFLGVGLAGVIASVLVALLLGHRITRAIRRVMLAMHDISHGERDLTRRLPEQGNDELAVLSREFNSFLSGIHDLVFEFAQATREVAAASTQIAASSDSIAEGMQGQHRQAIEVSAAVEEMTANVREMTVRTTTASRTASGAIEQATQGGKVVECAVSGVSRIAEVVRVSAGEIGELGRRGEEIGKVIQVINEIADQTNLLALNAAIEAARAGDHGRGFAVVADEVRKLAERTSMATKDVTGSIREIQGGTNAAVDHMNSGLERVAEGVQQAEQAQGALTEIVSGSHQLTEMIQSIAAAVEQQSAATEEIARAIEEISRVSTHSADGAQQAAEAAGHLSRRTEQLQALVGQFRLTSEAGAQL